MYGVLLGLMHQLTGTPFKRSWYTSPYARSMPLSWLWKVLLATFGVPTSMGMMIEPVPKVWAPDAGPAANANATRGAKSLRIARSYPAAEALGCPRHYLELDLRGLSTIVSASVLADGIAL